MKSPTVNSNRIFLSVLLILSLIGSSCIAHPPIRIGFAGELAGRNADLGIQGRNGALLAIDLINQQEGIRGRQVDLIIRDDHGTPEGARDADRQRIDSGLVTGLVTIAHQLDISVVAEGVETIQQLEFFERLRCNLFQGHFFSTAKPPEELTTPLRDGIRPL
jgi:hypothetical protein